MTPDDKLLNQELRRDEGVRYSPYFDTVGVQTVGVGHNLKVKPLPAGWTYPLTDAQVNQLLAEDLNAVFIGLDRELPWWRTLSYERQRVLANMAFNLGIDGLLGFKNALAAMQQGCYAEAASRMMQSKWTEQVGARAIRLAGLMKGDAVAQVALPAIPPIPTAPVTLPAPSGVAALLSMLFSLLKGNKS